MQARTVGFIGVGRMGGRMARRLVDAGLTVRAYDPVSEAVATIAAAGGVAADSAAGAAEGAEVVLCSLPGPTALEDAVLGPLGVLEGVSAGTTVVDTTTGDPETSRRVARACAADGVRFLDAPVSRGLVGAETGTLAMLVGGDDEVLAQARPLLRILASDIVHVGPVGAGQIAKLCANMLSAIQAVALAEVLVAGVKAGIGIERLTESISRSSATSYILEHYLPRGLFTAERPTTFALSLMRKDLGLFMDAASRAGAVLPISSAVQQLYAAAGASVGEDADFTSVAELYERLSDVELRLEGEPVISR